MLHFLRHFLQSSSAPYFQLQFLKPIDASQTSTAGRQAMSRISIASHWGGSTVEDVILQLNSQLSTDGLQPERILNASLVQTAAIRAFVLAMAGMMFLVTPKVSISVTPSILNYIALSLAF